MSQKPDLVLCDLIAITPHRSRRTAYTDALRRVGELRYGVVDDSGRVVRRLAATRSDAEELLRNTGEWEQLGFGVIELPDGWLREQVREQARWCLRATTVRPALDYATSDHFRAQDDARLALETLEVVS